MKKELKTTTTIEDRKILIVARPKVNTLNNTEKKVQEYFENGDYVTLALDSIEETPMYLEPRENWCYIRSKGHREYDWGQIFNYPSCGDVNVFDDVEIVGDIQEVIPIAIQLQDCNCNITVDLRYCNVGFKEQNPIIEVLRRYGVNVNKQLF